MNTGIYCSLYEAIAWQMFQTEDAMNFARQLSAPSETHLMIWRLTNHKFKKPYIEFQDAYDKILHDLQAGKLTAYGRKHDRKRSEEISVDEWRDLSLSTNRKFANTAYLKNARNSPIELRDVCFLKEEVKSLFPLNKTKKQTKKASPPTLTANTRHREWAKSYFNALKRRGEKSTRTEDEKAFRDNFQASPREIVRSLRKEFVPEWCQPGRRRSN